MPVTPSTKIIKALFAVCRNRCAFPKCAVPAYDPESGTILLEICHIEGHKPDSARYRAEQSDEDRHGFNNLILMCGVHHKVIDDDIASYTVERLKQIKSEHESVSSDASLEKVAESASNQLLANFSAGIVYASTVIVSQNQMGGQIAQTIINNAPPRRQLSEVVMQKLITELQKYPPRNCEVLRVQGDEEASALANQLGNVLKQAGWTVGEIVLLASDARGFEIGLRPKSVIPTDVQVLVKYLLQAGIMKEPRITGDPKCEILKILVGHRDP